jgi:hypothetical protein
MFYSILIYVSEDKVAALTPEQEQAHVDKHLKIHEKLKAQGKLGPVARLMKTSTAKHLRTAGKPTIVDGPFTETKEQLLGFYIVDCESEQEAIDLAGSLPTLGTIFEIRPVQLFFAGCGLEAGPDGKVPT